MLEVETDTRGVIHLFLNRPQVHNAFNPELIHELTWLFADIAAGKRPGRLVVLQGKGRSFCAGADLNWMQSMKDYSEAENLEDAQKLAALFESIDSCPLPTIAAVQGAAVGGGAGLVATCDHALSSQRATFGFTEVRLGLIPATIGPYVVRKIGENFARSTFLSGVKFEAEIALQMGLVHEVCAADEFSLRLEKTIDRFLKAAPMASVEAKALIKLIEQSKASGLSQESINAKTSHLIAGIRRGEEAQKGMQALLNKQTVQWDNRES